MAAAVESGAHDVWCTARGTSSCAVAMHVPRQCELLSHRRAAFVGEINRSGGTRSMLAGFACPETLVLVSLECSSEPSTD